MRQRFFFRLDFGGLGKTEPSLEEVEGTRVETALSTQLDAAVAQRRQAELKGGSIGEGPNHSNHSNHSNSFKIGISPACRKFKIFRKLNFNIF